MKHIKAALVLGGKYDMDNKERIAEAIDYIAYLPNGVAAWVETFQGNRSLASAAAAKLKKAEELLSEVIAMIPGSMVYNVYGLEKNKNLSFESRDELIAYLKKAGIKYTGDSDSSGLKPQLQGQPTFDKLIGPMYDGGNKIRYETQDVYDTLSR